MTIAVGATLGIIGTIVGAIGAIIRASVVLLANRKTARITNPLNNSENAGRLLTISGEVPRHRARRTYWIAIQPADCRATGAWWPQNRALTFHTAGGWTLSGARLGREGEAGEHDVNKSFTLGLFEVSGPARHQFKRQAAIDKELSLTSDSTLLHSVQVRRVRYVRDTLKLPLTDGQMSSQRVTPDA